MSADLFLLLFGVAVGGAAGVFVADRLWRRRYEQVRTAYVRVLGAWALEVTEHGVFLQILGKGKDGPRA